MKISLNKIIRAMSIALDLAEISYMEYTDVVEKTSNINYSDHKFLHHSKRTAYIALKLANYLNLEEAVVKELYISSLLHDIGAISSLYKSHTSDSFIKEHCSTGSMILSDFPIFSNMSHIILYHHENWDGSGPMKLKGSSIPIESQLIRISDLLEVVYEEKLSSFKQKQNIINWVSINSGTLFSPEMVDAFLNVAEKDIFWFDIENMYYIDFVLDNISPNIDTYVGLKEFQHIAYIFANIIDKKSKFTARHSREISELSYKVSKHIGYDEEKCLKMKIAGLLHDLGKLAIPSDILDKEGPLSNEEFSIIKSHSYYTKIILDKIEDIRDISAWASNHHEKLNGNGYPRSLCSNEICEESRIMGVCDIYQALTEDRPYRKGLSQDRAFSILEGMIDDGLVCKDAVSYLKGAIHCT